MNGPQRNPRGLVSLLALLGLLPAFPAPCATTWFVDGATSASADGLTWATAKRTIQEAVDAASDGDQIWVAEGLYSEHVTLKSGLSLYGGFRKTEASVDDRDLANHRTMMDGTGRTVSEILLLRNVTGYILDGFDVRNALRMGVHVTGAPGANGLGSAIRNCRFTGSHDAAVQIEYASCAFENCYFANNGGEAALIAAYDSYHYTYRIQNSVFQNNAGFGLKVWGVLDGFVYPSPCRSAEIAMDQCVIVGNGRGVYVQATKISIANCLIAGNAGEAYAGICCVGGSYSSPISIDNCTIADNTATVSDASYEGGGLCCLSNWHYEYEERPMEIGKWICVADPSYLKVTNCIFGNNDPNGMYLSYYTYPTLKNNLFHENAYAVQAYDDFYRTAADVNNSISNAADNVDGDPAFINPAAGDYRLSRNSFAIDRGTTVSLAFDLDGAPRPIDAIGIGGGGTFDIGAYECQDQVVYSPTLGQACRGQMPIRWVDSRVAGAEVGISLWRDGARLRDVSAATANDGEFLWPIPPDSAGGGWQVGVAGSDAPGTLQFSGVFSIVVTLPPRLIGAWDAGGGKVGMTWTDDSGTSPSQYLSFVYDVYENKFTSGGWGGTMWFPFPFPARSGELNVVQTGGYHAWVSGLWTDGTWLPCPNPQTLIVYSGRPHMPSAVWTEDRGGGAWRLHWAPELYGTWLAQVLVHQDGVGWITPLDGPSSAFPQLEPWTFVDYGGLVYNPAKADFFEGWADFTLPPGAPLAFYLNFRAWDGATQGPFTAAEAN